MKKTLALLLIILTILGTTSCGVGYRALNDLEFGQLGAPGVNISDASIIWNIDEDEKAPSTLTVYKKTNENKEAIWNRMIEVYGFKDAESVMGNDRYLRNGEAELMWSNLGNIQYIAADDDENSIITLTNEEMTAEAKKALENIGFDIDNFSYDGTTQTEINGKVISKGIRFCPVYDGYKTIGISVVSVSFMNNELSEISIAYSDGEPAFSAEVKTYEELNDEVANNADESIVLFETEKMLSASADKLEVTSVEIVYIEHSPNEDEEYIQPFFRLSGTVTSGDESSTFYAYVRALKDEYYK